MKLTIDLYDAEQRADALNILGLFETDTVEEEEVIQLSPETQAVVDKATYLPEDTPVADPVAVVEPAPVVVPKVSLDPAAPPAEPEVVTPVAPAITAKDVQDLAMALNKAKKIDREGLVTRLASYGGAVKISGLDEAGLAAFYGELLNLKGEADV